MHKPNYVYVLYMYGIYIKQRERQCEHSVLVRADQMIYGSGGGGDGKRCKRYFDME